MKPLSATFLAIVLLAAGFIAGVYFSSFSSKQKLTVKKEHLDYLKHLHNSYRNDSKKAYASSVTISNKIFPLIDDGTLLSKGKASSDPIKKLLLESYECISGNMQVMGAYSKQVYRQDSAFLKMYIKLE